LPDDVRAAIAAARDAEPWPVAKRSLELLQDNMDLARQREIPVCQDTGMACVFLELGQEVHIAGDLNEAVQAGIREGYTKGYLRCSVVADPLRRMNTGDNTPGVLTVHLVPGDACRLTVLPKGFGSENMSRLAMLTPAEGEAGVRQFVLDTVRAAGPNPCPPIVVGVGIGGTFDRVAALAKQALLRPLDQSNPDPYYADLERSLLEEINALGIGPQGFGGRTTALHVAIETAPTHVAGLPVAVNINCHVTRRAGAEL
jgi:fumarate hydratase subunit alpha